MALLPITWVVGISSILLLLLGVVYCVLFLFKFIYVKKILVPIVAMVALCCGGFYLGPTVSFINLLVNGVNIESRIYYFLSYIWLPIGTIGIILMALNVFYPKMQKSAIIVYGIQALIFYIFMFAFPEQQHKSDPVPPGALLDIGHANVSLVLAAFSLVSVLVIDSGGFFILSNKLKKRDFPQKDIRKAFMIGLGWLLFVISGIVDALFSPDSVLFVLIMRILMIIAYNLIYLGFWSKPARLEAES